MHTFKGRARVFVSGLRLAAAVSLSAATAAPATFIENTQAGYEGTVKFEAETFAARTIGLYGDPPSLREWSIVPDERGGFPALYTSAYGDKYIQIRTDSGTANTGATPFDDGPTVAYEVQILTPGTYTVFARFSGHDTSSDSVWVRVREATGYFQLAAPNADFRDSNFADSWRSSAASAHGGAVGTTIQYALTAGTYHVEFALREDGFSMDQVLLTRQAAFTGAGDANKLPVPLSVPEPAAALVVVLGASLLRGRRRRH